MDFDEIEKKFGHYKNKKLTRQVAIKVYCKELCSAGDYRSWADCSFIACPLWRFRKGTELKVNSGSFGIRGRLNIKKKKSVLKPHKINGFGPENSKLEGGSDE